MGGLAASFFIVIGQVTGYWGMPTASGQFISTIEFWWSQAGTHILVNMIWGTIFGALFTKIHDIVPGEKIVKGLNYGLILFLITSFYMGTFLFCWAINHNNLVLVQQMAGGTWITGGANAIVFGLVLGLLYRKPPK